MTSDNKTHIYIESNEKKQPKRKTRPKSNEFYKCELCDKKYKTERGLLFHMCENKRRLNEKEELHSRIGFMAYIKFYETVQKNDLKKNPKTFTDFAKSKFYKGFIKFGHYVADMKMNEPDKYIDFLIKNDVPLDRWTDDRIYEKFVINMLKNEKPDYAIERSIKTMEKWAEKNNLSWPEYFNKAGSFRIISNVRTGKISPWILYNTKSGKQFLNNLDEQQINNVYNIIDPDYWKRKFTTHKNETNVIINVLKNAGL